MAVEDNYLKKNALLCIRWWDFGEAHREEVEVKEKNPSPITVTLKRFGSSLDSVWGVVWIKRWQKRGKWIIDSNYTGLWFSAFRATGLFWFCHCRPCLWERLRLQHCALIGVVKWQKLLTLIIWLVFELHDASWFLGITCKSSPYLFQCYSGFFNFSLTL